MPRGRGSRAVPRVVDRSTMSEVLFGGGKVVHGFGEATAASVREDLIRHCEDPKTFTLKAISDRYAGVPYHQVYQARERLLGGKPLFVGRPREEAEEEEVADAVKTSVDLEPSARGTPQTRRDEVKASADPLASVVIPPPVSIDPDSVSEETQFLITLYKGLCEDESQAPATRMQAGQYLQKCYALLGGYKTGGPPAPMTREERVERASRVLECCTDVEIEMAMTKRAEQMAREKKP